MKSFVAVAETFKGWTRFGLSVGAAGANGDVSVHGTNAVTDPFNDRRVVADGLIQAVDPNTGIWTDFPAVVSWDVGDAGTPEVGGPVDVAAKSKDGRVTVAQQGMPRTKLSPTGQITFEFDLLTVIL